jgi:hypothetical protein
MKIYSNSFNSNNVEVKLSGKTSVPQIDADAYDIYFGYQDIGQTTTKTLKIFNTGQIDLTISDIFINGNDAGSFSFSSNCTTISPGDTCDIEMSFTPGATKDCEAGLGISSNSDKYNPLPINLHGSSVPRHLRVTPAEIDFGDLAIGNDSTVQLLFINEDTATITITGLNQDGGYYEFFISGAMDTIPGHDTLECNVQFKPYFAGNKTAVLKISSDDSDNKVIEIPLTGNAIDKNKPKFSISGSVVTPDDDPVTTGTIFVCEPDDSNTDISMWWKPLEGSDIFTFTDIPKGVVTLRCDPDTTHYPGYLRTYLGGKLLYSDALFFDLNKDTTDLKITLIPAPTDQSGSSSVSGILVEETGTSTSYLKSGEYTGSGTPVSDVPVILKGSNGETTAYDITNSYGEFRFNNLQPGRYKFYADNIGYVMDGTNDSINIDGDFKDYYISAIAANKTIKVEISEVTGWRNMSSSLSVSTFPNPVSDNVYLHFNGSYSGSLVIRLLNITGSVVKEIKISDQTENTTVKVPVSGLSKGIYLLTIRGKDVNYTMKIVKR